MKSEKINLNNIIEAGIRLSKVIETTPLQSNERLSQKYNAKIYLKREDLQRIRSYKIRGAYNFISLLSKNQRKKGVVTASAGNHAQGVALSCNLLKIKGDIFMPRTTPRQKIEKVKDLGGEWINIQIMGDTYDEAFKYASEFAKKTNKILVHPFDDPKIIAGQGTIAYEIFNQLNQKIDYLVVPIGGGGLISGISLYVKSTSPKTKIIGAEPQGAPAMYESLKKGKIIELQQIDKFVDGAAVKKVGQLTFPICKKYVDRVILVDEGKICLEMLDLYQKDGIIAEPAGALSLAALDQIKNEIKNKTVVCILSGGNNDVSRYAEIFERALIYQGLKHYFIIEFSQRPGSLKRYLNEVLGPNDDIVFFEYIKKNNKEFGPALVGIELANKKDFLPLISKMNKIGLHYEIVKPDSVLFRFLI